MSRTPLPADTVKRSFDITRANADWLARSVTSGPRTFREALNDEVDYVRTFALPPQLLARLVQSAKQGGLHPRAYVQALLRRLAASLPPTTAAPASPKAAETRRTASSLSGPNDRFLLRTATEEGLDWNSALRLVLDFSRTYGLAPEELARLERAAQRRGLTARDLANEALLAAVVEAADAQERPVP